MRKLATPLPAGQNPGAGQALLFWRKGHGKGLTPRSSRASRFKVRWHSELGRNTRTGPLLSTPSSASSRCERPEMRAPTVRPRDRLLPEAEAAAVEVAAGAQAAEAAAGAAAAASAGRAGAIPWGTVYQPPTEMPARCSRSMAWLPKDRSMALAQDGPLVEGGPH
jgi:hypothetical protein